MAEYPRIVRNSDGRVIAHAERAEQVAQLEGNWYFHPECVDMSLLEVSDRTYTCPYKGTCLWVDLERQGQWIHDAAWVYPEPKPGYRRIKGWIGFYPEHPHYACVYERDGS